MERDCGVCVRIEWIVVDVVVVVCEDLSIYYRPGQIEVVRKGGKRGGSSVTQSASFVSLSTSHNPPAPSLLRACWVLFILSSPGNA
jgi:hypothetical protein